MTTLDSLNNPLMTDGLFYRTMVDKQASSLVYRLSSKIAGNVEAADQIEQLIEAVAVELADLQARLKIVEAVVASAVTPNSQLGTAQGQGNTALLSELTLTADLLSGLAGFWPKETAENGLLYCWTRSATTHFGDLAVDRSSTKYLTIRFTGEVKPGLLGGLKLLVDGKPHKFSLKFDGVCNALKTKLPKVKGKRDTTLITLQISSVHSPTELGTSADVRKLGVALHSVAIAGS